MRPKIKLLKLSDRYRFAFNQMTKQAWLCTMKVMDNYTEVMQSAVTERMRQFLTNPRSSL